MISRINKIKKINKIVNGNVKLTKKNIDFIKNILDSFHFPFLVLDSKYKIVTLNNSFSDTYGFKPTEIEHQEIYSIGSKQWDIPEFKKIIEEVTIQDQKIIRHQIEHVFPVFGKRVISLSAQSIKASRGKSKYVLLIIEDITKQKELDDIKNSFLSIAAHDLRTPMTIIMGYIDMFLNGDFGHINPKMKKSLVEISSASLRMIRIINDFLTISRVNEGKLNINIKKFDLIPVIKEMIGQIKRVSTNTDIKIVAKNLPNSLNVLADSDKVREVIYNLLDNAVKFTNKGSITIEAKKIKNFVVVSVLDTGEGIAKNLQKKLFGKYYQIKNTGSLTSSGGSGLGLGLYISRIIIQACGGKIWVESKPNIGSKFSFSLPI